MTRKRKGADLPGDYARCNGVGDDVEGWREGCEDCLRRTSPRPERAWMIEPPAVIAFFCENRIGEEFDQFERKRQPQRDDG